MTTQAPPSSQDLAAARELLNELHAETQGSEADAQTKAVTATAHAILVLAEQVAAIRILMVGDAVARREENQPEAEGKKTTKKRGWW
jgi:hypothetical protein